MNFVEDGMTDLEERARARERREERNLLCSENNGPVSSNRENDSRPTPLEKSSTLQISSTVLSQQSSLKNVSSPKRR
jgi:hypothetical protein